ncbi:hypothetical protein JCM19233_3058 [Vibrio astriarenae]|nr:hypothetical protein JCM19233_3058 [Vibrio sp. C7]
MFLRLGLRNRFQAQLESLLVAKKRTRFRYALLNSVGA